MFISFVGPGVVIYNDNRDAGAAWGALALLLVPWFLSTGLLQVGIEWLLNLTTGQPGMYARRTHVVSSVSHDGTAEEWFIVSHTPTSPIVLLLNALIPTMVIMLLLRFLVLARAHGALGALLRVFDPRAPLPTAEAMHGTRVSRADRAQRVAAVSEAVAKMPIETWRSREQLRADSVPRLRQHMRLLGLSSEGVVEKEELVSAILGHGGATSEQCSICYEEYEPGVDLRLLPCGHKFHVSCIDRWAHASTEYSRPSSCPMCNAPLVPQPAPSASRARDPHRPRGSPPGENGAPCVGIFSRLFGRGGSADSPAAAGARPAPDGVGQSRPGRLGLRIGEIRVRDAAGGGVSHGTTVDMRTGEGDMETDGGLASPSSGAEAIAVGREESAEGVGSEDGGARRLLGRLRSFAPADGSLLDSDDEHPAAVLD